jgi:hypothetical protein
MTLLASQGAISLRNYLLLRAALCPRKRVRSFRQVNSRLPKYCSFQGLCAAAVVLTRQLICGVSIWHPRYFRCLCAQLPQSKIR